MIRPLIIAVFLLGGCSQLHKITPETDKVNCLDFAVLQCDADEQIVFGLYLPNQSTYHAWVKRKDGMCMDQMRTFKCDDARYKALSVPSVDDLIELMGSRV